VEVQARLKELQVVRDELPKVKINFLRNFTIEPIEPFLSLHCLRNGINPEIVFGNYDNVNQEILSDNSHIYTEQPDIIVVSLYLENMVPESWDNDTCLNIIENIERYVSTLLKKTPAIVVLNSFIPPSYSDTGLVTNLNLSSKLNGVYLLNAQLRKFVSQHSSRLFLVDSERLIRILGWENSIDKRFWYMNKSPFKYDFLNLYAEEIFRFARALKGGSKKCLILDCDNTIWGGIVGEDGVNGIKLCNQNYPGLAFYEFQKFILQLHSRGVLIALCSKNNEADVFSVLESHPHCKIGKEHLVAWRINWTNKADNIRSMATELNLGLDSFVFVDDSPLECEQVSSLLPEVEVVQVPKKLYDLPELLSCYGFFDSLSLTAEDRNRTIMYKSENQRKLDKSNYETLDDYLSGLEIRLKIGHVTEKQIPRVAQLTQKTNQFNLTTKRYSEGDIREFVHSDEFEVLYAEVEDKFGDMGITGVFISHRCDEVAVIDTFLLSCRVLGRNIESTFLLNCLEIVDNKWNPEMWNSCYIPTKKNIQVKDFWDQMNFKIVNNGADDTVQYELNKDIIRTNNITYITVVKPGENC
jgi:FkbH-like protein